MVCGSLLSTHHVTHSGYLICTSSPVEFARPGHATFDPRILHITSKTTTKKTSQSKPVRFKARELPPVSLQICCESRALALKHYVASFHPMTSPHQRASEMTHTAVYFSPELDAMHVVDEFGCEFVTLAQCTDKETIRSISLLAFGSVHKFSKRRFYSATCF